MSPENFNWDRERQEQNVKDMEEKHTDIVCPNCNNPTFIMVTLFEQVQTSGALRRNVKGQIPRCTKCGNLVEVKDMRPVTLRAV